MRTVFRPVILIPADGPPSVEDLPDPSYPFIRDAIGGTFDVIRVRPGLDLWCLDDSYAEPINWVASAFLHAAGFPPVSGPALLTSVDDMGETKPLPVLWAAETYLSLDALYTSVPERV